jgi:hypothetical protein
MAATQQPPTPPAGQPAPSSGAPAQACASCGAALAPDQRYCLNCGTRRGEPRVAPLGAASADSVERTVAEAPARPPSEVSPLAAVIGIALLGGMLLIGVLIGRGADNDPQPAPVVEVGGAATTTPAPGVGGESEAVTEVTSEWPEGTDGFTLQLSTLPKDGTSAAAVEDAKQRAIEDGAIDAAVLDSDQYASLPPGNYVIYSGVYTDRRSAEVALKGLRGSFPSAAVVEVADEEAGGSAESTPPETENLDSAEELDVTPPSSPEGSPSESASPDEEEAAAPGDVGATGEKPEEQP